MSPKNSNDQSLNRQPTRFSNMSVGTSLVVQWLRLRASTAGDAGSIPGWGTKILHAAWCSQKKKKKECQIDPQKSTSLLIIAK